MADRVGRQLGRDEGDGSCGFGIVREAGPVGELLGGEVPREPGASSGAAEAKGSLVVGADAEWCGLVRELMLCHGASVGERVRR